MTDFAPVRRHFLSWDAPLLPQAVRWLADGWTGAAALDLSALLVVVPTRQAGRRLRAALAAHAAEHGQAVFPPTVFTPEKLLTSGAEVNAASALESLLAWTRVFAEANLDELRPLFPVDPPARTFAWAHGLAQNFLRLQSTLAEGGLKLADVVRRTPADFPERARWECIAALERRQALVLAAVGKREPQACHLAAAQAPELPPGVERIVVVAVPDPLPLSLTALGHHATRVPVDIVIAAPAAEAESFDEWGRPRAEAWARREPPFEAFNDCVHLVADAAAQAERLAELAASYEEPDGVLGVGVADPEIAALAENALVRAGRAAFNPAGELHRAHGFFQFVSHLADFAREPSFAHTLAIARAPETLAWLRAELGGNFSATHWLAALDDLHCEHLPATLAQALRHASEASGEKRAAEAGLARLADLRAEMRADDFAPAAAAVLARVFAARKIDLDRAEDRAFADTAAAWSRLVQECAGAARIFPQFSREEWWEIALRRFGEQPRETDKPPGAVELQGWLELPWEDAPHVVVAGCNEGCVPEAIVGDVFLPESLRALLGLKTNAARFARDAYLLHALVASRRAGGRVDLLLGKVSAGAEPLRPSRLLLQCADAELPARIAHLFRPLESRTALPAWERPWQLRPRRAAPPAKLSPTAFRSYLECPFRFYLRHVLRMESVDPEKCELDALDFGTLCHAPLEKFAEEPWSDCTDERLLAAMLVEEFDRIAAARFGGAPAVSLVAQLESARQRLRRAAAVQARERADGWVTVATERKFHVELGGVTISGKIDRIDRHERTGEWRVLDYKTTDSSKQPGEAHLGTARDGAPEWALTGATGKTRAWIDLQLPLYVHALPVLMPEATARPLCGYFNLPKAVASTAVALWDGYTIELHEAALHCAEAVVAAVREGKFWPPGKHVKADYDAFATLFHRGAAESVEWEESP